MSYRDIRCTGSGAARPRRAFLHQALGTGLGLAASASLRGAQSMAGPASGIPLPTIRLGDKTVTRLISGGNPIVAASHTTAKLSDHMEHYFTAERITEYILHLEKVGITTWQTSYTPKVRAGLLAARERGSKIQCFFLSLFPQEGTLKDLLALKPFAVVHHGELTDRLFRDNKQTQIHDSIKEVHDAGILAGVSTHSPENVARVEDLGWENDFYMTCFYNIRRDREEVKRKLGDDLIGELYFRGDPARMTARMREVKKPCLGFKILAAGRLCSNRRSVETAFQFALKNIKPIDGVVVGMYPVFSDEVQENADIVRQISA